MKFVRSNQGTCLNQRPHRQGRRPGGSRAIPSPIDASTDGGELALGHNVLVAFMSWEGYNFEDAIIISESPGPRGQVHVHPHREARVEARDTKLGPEEITRDIPNVGEESLQATSTRTGSSASAPRSSPATSWSARSHPKGETELTAEEKLLRAIFGEKAREVKDTSLRVPHGERRQGHRRARSSLAKTGDELPPASTSWCGCGSPRSASSRSATRWPAATATRASSPDPARRGHALPARRHAHRHHPQPDRRPEPDERRPGAGNAPRLGPQRPRLPRRDAGVRRGDRGPDPRGPRERQGGLDRRGPPPGRRQDQPPRRPDGRGVRPPDHRRPDLHAEAHPPGGGQDPRPLHGPLLASSPSSRSVARPSSAASASARWRSGRWKRMARRTSSRSS